MDYKLITIYCSEEDRWHHHRLYEAILTRVRDLKIAVRCLVHRGIAGLHEDGHMATAMVEVLSFKMPIKIEIIVPAEQCQGVLSAIDEMLTDGLVTVADLNVALHKSAKAIKAEG